MRVKRGRPPSQKTVELRQDKDAFKKMMGDAPDFLKNEPFPNQLTQGVVDGIDEGVKRRRKDFGYKLPVELIDGLCMDEVDPQVWDEYQQRLNINAGAQKAGGIAKRDNIRAEVKEMCERETNKTLINRIKPSDLSVNEVAEWIHIEWAKRGIKGAKQKGVRQIRRDIKSYLKNNSK